MKTVRDTWLLFQRGMRVSLRNPVWVILGLFQPILYLLLFAPLLDQLTGVSGFDGNALNTFTPGLLVMTALFGSAYVGFGLIDDLRTGIVERLRVTPASRLSLLLGMVLRDMLMLLVQSALLIGVATLMGLRADPVGLLLLMGLMGLISLLLAPLSYSIALAVKDEGALAASLNTLTQPLMLLSGILLPMALAPAILRTLSDINPFSHAVNAARALVDGHLTSPDVAGGFVILAVLAILTMIWAVRAFRQATA